MVCRGGSDSARSRDRGLSRACQSIDRLRWAARGFAQSNPYCCVHGWLNHPQSVVSFAADRGDESCGLALARARWPSEGRRHKLESDRACYFPSDLPNKLTLRSVPASNIASSRQRTSGTLENFHDDGLVHARRSQYASGHVVATVDAALRGIAKR